MIVYIDHKNLTYKNFNTERVMRWCLILEEFNPELVCVPGENNEAADALSRLETLPSTPLTPASTAELFGFEDDYLPADTFPLTYKLIMQHQLKDEELMTKAEAKMDMSSPHFVGVTNSTL